MKFNIDKKTKTNIEKNILPKMKKNLNKLRDDKLLFCLFKLDNENKKNIVFGSLNNNKGIVHARINDRQNPELSVSFLIKISNIIKGKLIPENF